ncbi:MAG: chemotaxis protein CheA [Proteobacteria bacterium]|nr:chemotaxis protein CheA [Pseudomonadota bacterium]MBI3496345.1 chemotaxis protein CheA [Pseudomonadota bacterium]
MDDLIREFLTETAESMVQVDNDLVALEQDPGNADLIGRIFRLVHTIKGTCGFLGLPRLEKLAHAGENVLGRFREGSLTAAPASIGVVLESLDRIKGILAAIEQADGVEPQGDDAALIARLDAIYKGETPAETAAVATPSAEAPAAGAEAEAEPVSDPTPAAPPNAATKPEPVEPNSKAAGSETSSVRESAVANQSIRVAVELLEGLMTTVSELVLTRNQLLQALRSQDIPAIQVPLQHLSKITSELQEGIMKTRMQPIGNAWSKLPRLVRDLTVDVGKKIDLQMNGAETELDRQVLELIRDPLTHMVRNSADHGLERPEDRLAAGKPETGTITLNAFHRGGHIIIEVKDDGRGLPVEKIRRKAIQNGLVTEAAATQMTPQQIQSFIFKAGFSTAEKVTAVSGRGVGMDVVRTNIERIGGTIELASEEGKGTAFSIKIPLTLAIVAALIVAASGQRFAIPQIAVSALVRAKPEQIEHLHGAAVFRLRNRLLPLVDLGRVLGLKDESKLEGGFIVVTQVGSQCFGIVVDRVYDTEEIVVKPVAPILRALTVYAGNTILGDGSVIMILDPNGLASTIGGTTSEEEVRDSKAAQVSSGRTIAQLILFQTESDPAPKAVPLGSVARLEELESSRVEIVDGAPVVQYRDELMPLTTIDPRDQIPTSGNLSVLVFGDQKRTMGLVVQKILDIVETPLDIKLASKRLGMLGTAVIAGKATEIIDVEHFVSRAFADSLPLSAMPEESQAFRMAAE